MQNFVILKVRNFKKKFDDKVVHQDINFDLKRGETLGLLGKSGSGKSVLLKSLIGLETIDDGEIWFHDQRIDLLNEEELYAIRTKISYAFQNGALFDSLNIYDNLAYPLRAHLKLKPDEEYERISNMLSLVKLEDTMNLYPCDLSGGMQKRIGLARAMMLNPEIILYDEPTAGLDPQNVENILEIINQFKVSGVSGIFVSHDIPAAQKVCDRIIILDKGVIAFEGTFNEFYQRSDELNEFYQLNPIK